MKRLAIWIVSLVLMGGLAVGVAAFYLWQGYTTSGPLKADTVVIIEPGTGISQMASTLSDAGALSNPLFFRLGARIESRKVSLKAGEFLLPAGASARDLVHLLQEGETVVRKLTIAEGLTTAQVLAEIQRTEGLKGDITLVSVEGGLLPETYHFHWADSRNAMVARMQDAMAATLGRLWAARAEGLPLDSPEEALILASIVEKETGIPEERARVAAVFINRLKRGMRLQSDPTVVYALVQGQGALGRPLTRTDLKTDSPYNTYVSNGLPPGPICNPGEDSIRAVLNPMQTNEYYFVADGTGGHVFAESLKEHNRNVAKWRRIQHQRAN